jgi:hypothetical protein
MLSKVGVKRILFENADIESGWAVVIAISHGPDGSGIEPQSIN